ncbi:MAG: prepilin-type N-terminal cleavage/methylation domain-containing protein [Candidatus Omnitrophica bacterium]|nr:prepilin-type N-terminal cleavage/methylation domain-containing protein [Candidatus Omnitrophota bacterium]
MFKFTSLNKRLKGMRDFITFKRHKGITLIENVIGLLIAAIVFAGFLQVCNISSMMLQNIKFRVRAVNIAQAELEDIKSQNYDNIIISDYTPYKSTNVIIDGGPTSGSGDDVIGEMRTVVRNAINPPTSGKKVFVSVSWTLFGVVKRETAETIIYPN